MTMKILDTSDYFFFTIFALKRTSCTLTKEPDLLAIKLKSRIRKTRKSEELFFTFQKSDITYSRLSSYISEILVCTGCELEFLDCLASTFLQRAVKSLQDQFATYPYTVLYLSPCSWILCHVYDQLQQDEQTVLAMHKSDGAFILPAL